jgi:hypothetical protein
VGVWAGLKALGFGAGPCLLIGCVMAISGSYAMEPVPRPEGEPTAENLEARAALLRRLLPSQLEVRVEAPFVLVSEGSPEDAEQRAAIIRRTVDGLRALLPMDTPKTLVDVWVFADTESYRKSTRGYLGDWPRTLRGYWAPRLHAVIVNESDTVLAHEIVHPLLDASFPGCPAWFAEGLAALYEHAAERDGQLIGTVDGRLGRLRSAIARHKLPSIAALTVSTDREFYEDPRATNYTEARYLLLYLQERDLLAPYYHAFRDAHAEDPTGYATLQRTAHAEGQDLEDVWQSYVMDR